MKTVLKKKEPKTISSQLKWLFDQIFETYLLVDLDGNVLDGSQSIQHLLGVPVENIIHSNFLNLIYPNDQDKYLEIRNGKNFESDGRHQFTLQFQSSQGDIQFIDVTVYNFLRHPQIGSFLYFLQDVPNEKQLANNHLKTEQLLHTLLEYSNDLLIIVDENQVVTFATKGIERILGIPIQEFLGKPIHHFIHHNDQSTFSKTFNKILQSPNQEFTVRFRYIKNNSEPCDVEAKLINQLHLSFLKGIVIQTRDISEQCKLELERKKSSAAFQFTFRQFPDGLLICKISDYECIDINPRFTQLTGYEYTEIVGLSPFETNLFVEPNRIELYLYQLLENRNAISIETQIHKKDHSVLNVSLLADINEINNELCYIISIRDISEFVQVQQEHEQFLDRIRHISKIESLGVLAGGIAHDFNNLLAGILGFAELAEFYVERDSPVYEFLQKIQEAGKRAAFLSNQMLLYTGQSIAEMERIDLVSVVRKMMVQLNLLTGKNVRIEYKLPNEPCFIYGNDLLIFQLLQHLVTNANEAISFSGGKIIVQIEKDYYHASNRQYNYFHEYLAEGPVIILSVIDTGCGIDEDTLLKIFDPFYTTKFTGRGLGLSAVAGISRTHRAAIQVKSQPGQGSTFRILFPEMS